VTRVNRDEHNTHTHTAPWMGFQLFFLPSSISAPVRSFFGNNHATCTRTVVEQHLGDRVVAAVGSVIERRRALQHTQTHTNSFTLHKNAHTHLIRLHVDGSLVVFDERLDDVLVTLRYASKLHAAKRATITHTSNIKPSRTSGVQPS
jgi:hypothetical protein